MEELNTTVATEGTAPQDHGGNTTEVNTENAEQSAISAGGENVETEKTSANNEDLEQSLGADETTDSVPFLSLPHNHEIKSLSKEEAVDYIQTGLHAKPLMAELRFLAAQAGEKSVKSFIENLKVTSEEQRREKIRNQLVDQGNEDLFNSIFDAETSRIQNAAGVMLEDESRAFNEEIEGEHIRLAADFKDLQAEFPDIKEVKDIPDQVLRLAVEKNISLLDAQLRFNYAESKKINNAKKSAAAAAESSAGSVKSDETNSTSPVIEAMRKGLWH